MRMRKQGRILFAVLLASAVMAPGAIAQSVVADPVGFDIQVFAVVTDPFHLAFDGVGNLYAGRDASGSPPGTTATAARIHRISPDGLTVTEFGALIPDPDGVIADINGSVAAEGSILVSSFISGTTSRITQITPDGSSTTTLAQGTSPAISNPQQMVFNSSGDLLFANCGSGIAGGGTVGIVAQGLTTAGVFFNIGVPGLCFGGIALAPVNPSDRVFVSTLTDGRVLEVFPDNTHSVLKTGLSTPDALAYDVTGVFGSDKSLYVVERGNGNVTRMNPDTGDAEVFAAGFNQPFGLAFGADGCLYVSEFGEDMIWRICPTVLEASIDIQPGSFPNSTNPGRPGVIPVAILTADSLDATAVDPATVRFGRTGDEAAPALAALEDVDLDGDIDLTLHFAVEETGIQCGDTAAWLTAKTFSGQEIQASDSIQTVGCE